MESKPRSSHPFCARCGIAYLQHAYPESSCAKYISPGSKEARELEATKAESSPVDSALLDRVLMAGAMEHMQARIKTARSQLQSGLKFRRVGNNFEAGRCFEAALKALGGLGAS